MDLDDLKAYARDMAGVVMPTYTVHGSEVTASKTCPITSELYSVTMPLSGYRAWQAGELIQRALPQLTDNEREFLLSGNTPAMYADLFKDLDDNDGWN